jgi:light-regulated signal transduction histidine kinase (bacteriophytochrome)
MNDRLRLLQFCFVVLALTGLSCAAAVLWTVHIYLPNQVGWLTAPVVLVALGHCAVLIVGGGTLLVRTCGPFIVRLETTVAELRTAQTDLQFQAEELTRTNRELDEFTYIAAHDLKEPLRGIAAYCQILREDYAPKLEAEGVERLTTLERLCDRLLQLTDDLLAFARAGHGNSIDASADCGEVLNNVLEVLDPLLRQRGAIVRTHGPLPRLRIDPTLLGEVLRNLITNGVKFNESPQPLIEVGFQAGEVNRLYVRDNGIGIPSEHHEHVFAMFHRLHARHKYPGTGAGLCIVRRIVERAGGSVWLESTPGSGSTFFVSLPVLPTLEGATPATKLRGSSRRNQALVAAGMEWDHS